MIMPNRDPRIDPQRGDILRGNGQIRRVMAREGDRVRCASGDYDYRMRLDNWQKWCRLNGATAGPAASSCGLVAVRNYALGMPGSDPGGSVTGRFSRFYPKDSLAPEANR